MKMTKELAELIGIIYGDGCLSSKSNRYIIYVCGHKMLDLEYHKNVTSNLFLNIFKKSVKITQRKDENTLFIRFSDEKIFNIIHSIGMPIGKKYSNLSVPSIIKRNSDLTFCFMRGLADTDGSIIFSKQHTDSYYYPRIEISSKSGTFLEEILSLLTKHGFYGSISKKGPHFRLEIPGFKNFSRWLKLIRFNNPKHLKKIEAQLGPLRLRAEYLSVSKSD